MTTAEPSPSSKKAAVRSRIRAARRTRSEAEREHASGALAARALPLLCESSLVACYVSMASEPGTAALIDLLRQRGIRVLLPRVNGASLEWVELSDSTDFDSGAFGIREPGGASSVERLEDCEAIVMPALAVATDGTRLGQGGGYYDRALESVPSHADGGPVRIALLFDGELLDSLPREPHDVRVDHVVTPERLISF